MFDETRANTRVPEPAEPEFRYHEEILSRLSRFTFTIQSHDRHPQLAQLQRGFRIVRKYPA